MRDSRSILQAVCALPTHVFWPDSLSYLDISESGVRGHKQVTDAYLAALARANGGLLATMDAGLAALQQGVVLI